MAANHSTNVWMSRMVMEEQQFRPFEDYLGLSNLVKNLNLDSLSSHHQDSSYNGLSARSRSSSSSDDSFPSMSVSGAGGGKVWDEFRMNGVEVDSDEGFQPFSPKLESLLHHRKLLSRLPSAKNRRIPTWCVFCKNNGESEMVYGAHILKDNEGRTTCPILRNYTCPICGISGDGAHTIKYCPLNKEETFPPSANLLKTARTSTGKKRDLPSGLNRLN